MTGSNQCKGNLESSHYYDSMLSNGLGFFSAAQCRDSSFGVIHYVRIELEKISLEFSMQSGC